MNASLERCIFLIRDMVKYLTLKKNIFIPLTICCCCCCYYCWFFMAVLEKWAKVAFGELISVLACFFWSDQNARR